MKEPDISALVGGRLFDEVPCYISVQDRDFTVVEANAKIREDFGDPVGRKCYLAYKGRSRNCPECPVARSFEDGREHTSEETLFDRGGLPHSVVVHTRPLRDARGEIVAVMEVSNDVTVQKELQNRLHDSLNRFHNLFDTVPCYISVQDREFAVIEANQNFKERFGARLGGHCFQIYKRRDSVCPECPVALTFEDGKVHTSEQLVTDTSGRPVHVLVYTAPVRDARGGISAVMEVSADVTEVRAMQDKLASLGRLVGGIAHSIKNVLEGLRGGIYIANSGLKNDNREDLKTGLAMLERNVHRISNMILDMLYCAKDRSPRRLPVSLNTVVREVVEMYSARAREASVELITDLAEETPAVSGEPKDIHSLAANLVSNAIDACYSDEGDGKELRVVARVFPDSGCAVLEVEDNGVGMDEETRGKLFATFFSTKGAHGTGLGLLVAHKVATEHGGTIEARSQPGRGSVFTVRLPIASARPPA